MKILSLNIGSSSLKAKIFEVKNNKFKELKSFKLEGIKNYKKETESFLKKIARSFDINLVAHRVVHGGEIYKKAALVDKTVKKNIEFLSEIAPLHNPYNLYGIIISEKIFKKVKNVAVFDSAFHQTMPEIAYRYALPNEFYEKYKIRRYGFHGISHKYVSSIADNYLKKIGHNTDKIISCHLGNGCSITAIKDGHSIDTSMGFTPLEGLVMGTRCGDIDPALHFYICKKLNIQLSELEDILQKKSGLLGLSESSSDIRDILENYKNGDLKAKLAFCVFTYRIKKYISSYIGVLNGIDSLIFTGGIGENAYYIREMILNDFDFFPISIDKKKNRKNEFDISAPDSKVKILVIETNEELQMAKEAAELVVSGRRSVISK